MPAGVARSVSETCTEPLLPTGSNSASDELKAMSSHKGALDSSNDVFPVEVESRSFTTEPFHRFGNPASAHHPQAIVSSEDWLTGVVNGNLDPAVTKFGGKERTGINQNSTRLHSNDNYVHYKHDQNRTKWEEAALYIREGEDNDKFYCHPRGKWSKVAYKILHHPIFHVFDLVLSVLLMLLALIEKPAVFGTKDDERPIVTVHSVCEFLILGLLGVDIILRLIWLSPKYFIKHGRTMFISVVLCVMLVEALAVLIRQQSHLRITRSLRPVFLIDTHLMGGVRRVLRQIFQCLRQIVDVILLLLFIVAFFSLIAYFLFAVDDPLYFKTFGHSFVSLFITTTTANNPDVMMETFSRYSASPLFFIVYLVITLYIVNSILLAVVYSNFAEEEKDKFRKLFLHKREALRHAYSVLAGLNGIEFQDFLLFMRDYKPRIPEWQVMCVFKALLVNPREDHTHLSREEFYDFYEIQNLKWREVTDEGSEKLWFRNFKPSIKKVFQKLHAIVKWEWFNSIIYLVILSNMLFLVIYTVFITESEADHRLKKLHVVLPVSLVFLLVYIAENVLKILALGPVYFKKFWNIVDCLVLLLSLITLFLELDPSYHILVAVRPLKLIRLVRLKKRYRDIMNTLVVLTPRFVSVFLLLLIIYYFFAILGMEFFQNQVYHNCCQNASYNVGDYYTGLRNETTVDVYYLNNFDNLLKSYSTLFVLMVVNNWYIIMEAFASEVKLDWMARIYFITFYIVTLIVLQVVIAFIVDAFVLQLQQNSQKKMKQKKILERNIYVVAADDADCIEDELRKKEIRIALNTADIAKLKYEITYINETRKERFGLDKFMRYMRRIKLPEDTSSVMQCSGRRLRTKDDLQLWTYRAEIEQWIQEQDSAFRQVEESPPPERTPFKTKIWTNTKKVLVYLLE